ncbi:MAG TPA: hypothetical protein VJR27_02190 [Candidatus Saccharimonadales bacterium]|nr:hypothetical protein [Candidatus Saccharimonadales bacterium]
MSSPNFPHDDSAFEDIVSRLHEPTGQLEPTPESPITSWTQPSPLGQEACLQLADQSLYLRVPLIDTVEQEQLLGEDHHKFPQFDRIEGLAGFVLTQRSGKPMAEAVLVPPEDHKPQAFLERCQNAIKPTSGFIPGGQDVLTPRAFNALRASNTLFGTCVAQVTNHHYHDSKSFLALYVPEVYIHEQVLPQNMGVSETPLAYATKLSASTFHWLSYTLLAREM